MFTGHTRAHIIKKNRTLILSLIIVIAYLYSTYSAGEFIEFSKYST